MRDQVRAFRNQNDEVQYSRSRGGKQQKNVSLFLSLMSYHYCTGFLSSVSTNPKKRVFFLNLSLLNLFHFVQPDFVLVNSFYKCYLDRSAKYLFFNRHCHTITITLYTIYLTINKFERATQNKIKKQKQRNHYWNLDLVEEIDQLRIILDQLRVGESQQQHSK